MTRHGFRPATLLVLIAVMIFSPPPQHRYKQQVTAFVVVPPPTRLTSRNHQVAGSTTYCRIGMSPQPPHVTPLHAMSPMEMWVSSNCLLDSSGGASVGSLLSASSSSVSLSAATVDPTTFLQDLFGGVLGTPLILAIPILAALGVASLIAFAIVAYANPAESED